MTVLTHFSGKTRKAAALLLAVAVVLLLFPLNIPVQADAASYQVKHWTSSGTDYYTLYQGTLPAMYEPTFYHEKTDVYYNLYSGQDIRVTVFSPYLSVDEAQVQAFYQYLRNTCTAKVWYAGWYSLTDSYGFTSYHVYLIEGWNWSGQYPIDDLVNNNPYVNSEGYKLTFCEIGHGDLVRDQWNMIRTVYNCSTGIYLRVNQPQDGATVGLKFTTPDGEKYTRYE